MIKLNKDSGYYHPAFFEIVLGVGTGDIDFRASIMKEMGSPLITRNGEAYYAVPIEGYGDYPLSIFKALQQIVSLFEKGKRSCDMMGWCRKSANSTPDKRCETAPWLRCQDQQLCPVAMLWRNWGLLGYYPQ